MKCQNAVAVQLSKNMNFDSSFLLVSKPSYEFTTEKCSFKFDFFTNEGSWNGAVTVPLFKISIPRLFVIKMTKAVIKFCFLLIIQYSFDEHTFTMAKTELSYPKIMGLR